MSYILDALKKSEKERRRMSAPDLLTVQEPLSYERKRRSLWPYLVIVALLVNAAVFALWFDLRPNSHGPAVRAVSGGSGSNAEEKSSLSLTSQGKDGHPASSVEGRETARSETAGEKSLGHLRESRPEQAVVDLKKRMPAHRGSPQEDDKGRVVRSASSKETTGAAPQIGRKPDTVIPSPNRIYNLSELPPAIRQNLPEVMISVFLYSDDPSSRLVRINGQVLKEGQYLSHGLKLEQIVPGGAVFSYQSFRFLVGPK